MTRMAILSLLGLVCSAGGAAALDYRPRQMQNSGAVCIEGEEDNGAINIYPVSLAIDGTARRTFLGGDAACFYLLPGSHRLSLRWNSFDWQKSDHGFTNPGETSAPVSVSVLQGRTISLHIESDRVQGGNPRWMLRR